MSPEELRMQNEGFIRKNWVGGTATGAKGEISFISILPAFFFCSFLCTFIIMSQKYTYIHTLSDWSGSHSVAQDGTELSSPVESALQVLRLSLSHCSGL